MHDPGTETACERMRSFGFSATPIPERKLEKEQRADFLATWNAEEYVVEVKSRKPHEDWTSLWRVADTEGAATALRDFKLSSLSSKIMCAYRQLVSTPSASHAHRIFWFWLTPEDELFAINALIRQLLGLRRLTVYEKDVFALFDSGTGTSRLSQPVRWCYHYELNDFQRCPLVAAAVIATQTNTYLCLNHYSGRLREFRDGHLFAAVSALGVILDPDAEVQRGESLMLGSDFVGPRDKATRSTYLAERYDVLTNEMMDEWRQTAATVEVPPPSSDADG